MQTYGYIFKIKKPQSPDLKSESSSEVIAHITLDQIVISIGESGAMV